ncbi:MAG: hypothetical protein NC344_04150 [Bacteroidales bacterium]|nr:hypothetical protein [Bacteroidales bacterium]MCM1147020.1 hypothetical protein [Bacteroidales bacterium]MCM1205847.1 hypothetical protein [Bacillota bacterium]MCM1509912.1 hypothetical protein [Clostridium sp.]
MNIPECEEEIIKNLSQCQKEIVSELLSPRFSPKADCQWFVMRVTYGRAAKAATHINTNAYLSRERKKENALSVPYFAYTPHETKIVFKDGKRARKTVACLPGYIFFYGTERDAFRFSHRSQETESLPFLDFAYDHTQKSLSGMDRIMTIPDREMLNFIRLAEIETSKAYSVTQEECHFRKGGKVRIIHGVFEGIVGRVARIHTQTRVVVTLEGIISYATAYIPAAFMVPVEE